MDRSAADARVRGSRKLDTAVVRFELLLDPANREVGASEDRFVDGGFQIGLDLLHQEHSEAVFPDGKDLGADIAADGMTGASDSIEFNFHQNSFSHDLTPHA